MMTGRDKAMAAGAVVLMGLAAWGIWRFLHEDTGVSEKAFFYDLSEQKLFVADRGSIAPIRGINDAIEDGVRAVVISTNGQPQMKRSWHIAYLEMYAPELKAALVAAQKSGAQPAVSRSDAQGMRLVKRVADANWVALSSPEGERIASEWVHLAAPGTQAVVCSP